MTEHPYASGQPHQFWSRAMTWPAPGQVDPVTRAFTIDPGHRVATMGSCFAQHIARHLARSGCHYFVAEQRPADLSDADAAARQYGVFSARYGNVYTVRQAVQLFDRAFGRFEPLEGAWALGDRWVDPFRPRVEPAGHADPSLVIEARLQHLACVREVFTASDCLVFTLGLTEAWRDRRDGAVFPLAPGVAGGRHDPERYEFVNFGIDDTRQDLDALLQRLHDVNPGCRVILTVSPVPLAATFEPRHVWVSTTCSKAVLRVAADEAERRHDHVTYFPSYEVITSPAAGGHYYADDLRQVTELGVQHVMRLFSQHFIDSDAPRRPLAEAAADPPDADTGDLVCDEETIEHAMRVTQAGT